MSRIRLALLRAPFLVAYALALTFLAFRSSLKQLLPFDATPWPLGLYVFLGLLLGLLPSGFTRGSPLPGMLVVFVPVAAVGMYGASHLDWLRTLKDFSVASPAPPNLTRLALAAGALVLAWAAHAADTALRLRARLVERGVEAREASAAVRISLRRTRDAGLAGLAGFAVLALVGYGAYAAAPTLGRVTFLMPLLAAVGIAAAAVLLGARSKGEGEEAR